MAQISLILPEGRTEDAAWPSVRSWYGGLPRLSENTPWPTGLDNQPLHFLVQLDLAKLPSTASNSGCPTEGHLAFFADTEFSQPRNAVRDEIYGEYCWPCAVIYVEHAPTEQTALPPEMAPVYGLDWQHYFPGRNPTRPPKSFPKLAVEFEAFTATSQNLSEQLIQHWKDNPSYSPNSSKFEVSPDPSDILWRTVEIICEECLAALKAREHSLNTYLADRDDTPAKIQKFSDRRPTVEKVMAAWLELVQEDQLNQPIGAQFGDEFLNDLDDVKTILQEIKVNSEYLGQFNTRPGSGGHMDVPYYWYHGLPTWQAYNQMITGSDSDFSALPEQVREALWRDLSSDGNPPQSGDMFCGIDADGNINPISDALRQDATLLLELNSSFLWMWGDAGKLQFWIRNVDLKKRSWDKCFLLLRSS